MSDRESGPQMSRRSMLMAGLASAGASAAGALPAMAQGEPPGREIDPNVCQSDGGIWPNNRLATGGQSFKTDYAALREQRMSEVSEDLRKMYEAMSKWSVRAMDIGRLRDTTPQEDLHPDVTAYNIGIQGPEGLIPARVYRPKALDGQELGAYLHCHGGGWVLGHGIYAHDRQNSQHALDWQCAVVHPDFRLGPEHKFPAGPDDCFAAFQYIVDNSAELGVDKNRIGIGGGCAGGNISTVVSLMARDAGGTMPAVQWLWSPAFDMRNNNESHYEFANGYGLSLDTADFVTQLYHGSREDAYSWRASPILAETLKGAPPAIIWYGEWEILKDEAVQYINRMRESGCEVHAIEGPQQGHGFIYAQDPNTGLLNEYARKALPEINRLIRSYIGPEAA